MYETMGGCTWQVQHFLKPHCGTQMEMSIQWAEREAMFPEGNVYLVN